LFCGARIFLDRVLTHDCNLNGGRKEKQGMTPDFVLLHVHGGGKKVRVRRGDNVFITKRLDERVSKFPPPRVVKIHKRGTRLLVDVQYQTDDKKTRVESFLANELESVQPLFKIGDKVVVKTAHPSVVVSVGSRGTVVGGDGTTYHVTFVMDTTPSGQQLDAPIRVSQDRVDAAALEQVSDSASDISEEDDSSSDDSISEEEPRAPDRLTETLQRFMTERILNTAVQHLNSSMLADFAQWLAALPSPPHIESTQELQGYVVKFTRSRPSVQFPPEHIAALRAAGATSADIRRMQADATLHGKSARELVEHFTR
jgi:hypothetical protein